MQTQRAVGYVIMNGRGRKADIEIERTRRCIESEARAECVELVEVIFDTSDSLCRGLVARTELLRTLEMVESRSVGMLILKDSTSLSANPVVREFLLSRIYHIGCKLVTLEFEAEDLRLSRIRDVVGHFIDTADEYQSAIRAHRMRLGKEAKALHGGYVGGRPPFGMQVRNGDLIPHPEEAKTIGLVRELRAAGNSYREICRILDDLGITSRSGRPWQPMTIRRISERAERGLAGHDEKPSHSEASTRPCDLHLVAPKAG